MDTGSSSRRDFLLQSLSGLSSSYIALRWPAILSAQSYALAATAQSGFEFFSPAQAGEIEAMAAQIIPTDDAPGAREAQVIHFIDRVLVTFDRDKRDVYTDGLKNLHRKTIELFPGSSAFSSLNSEQQIQVLTSIENTEFFELVRLHTIMGFLSHPSYGGNHDRVGWKLIGFEDQMTYKPPFGYYDAEENKA